MINLNVDIAIIGGGPAGLAAAVSAHENGAKNIVILDRNSWLGGILTQCIHDGFGVEETGISMTGPEYADIYIKKAKKYGIKFMNETMVLQIESNKTIKAVNKKGLYDIKAKSIILSMGCREKTRWSVLIPGDRPSGIYTAGVAQAFINLYNIMVGKNVVILGSGDVGLIMARRLKFEGANVIGVVEILPHASGLPRNVVQCLDDYDIPLYLNHTVTYIKGRERLESVTIAQIDEKRNVIKGTEREIKCDTLLLSLGLIPENELSMKAGVEIDEVTRGPIVNQYFETTVPGIFACGNCLQVYDTVDLLTIDAKKAGKYAVKKMITQNNNIIVQTGKGVRYVLPQIIDNPGKIHFTLRVEKIMKTPVLHVFADKKEIFKKKLPWANPANMIDFKLDISNDIINTKDSIEVVLYDG
ncbi:oxidoreductase [Thermoplasmatales archaeon SG8-52-4]|nr:MAG: oxidoreductase [Thermoplasmatales archaeon SG8-52-4]